MSLHLPPGTCDKVIAPFAYENARLSSPVRQVRHGLDALLGNLAGTLAWRTEVEEEIQTLFRSVPHGRVVKVRLSTIDLTAEHSICKVEAQIEGEADDMLRPFREIWPVHDTLDLTFDAERFCEIQGKRIPLRDRARALDAIGLLIRPPSRFSIVCARARRPGCG